jgi:hypothetical protein
MEIQEKYNALNPEVIQLLNQLFVCKELYNNASGKLADEVATEKVLRLLAKKKVFLNEVANILDIDTKHYAQEKKKNIEFKLQKVSDEFEDLFLNGNDIELIAFLISTEKKLQKIYHQLISATGYDEFVQMIFKNQLSESKRDMIELQKLQEEYI